MNYGFNPCFNGYFSSTMPSSLFPVSKGCFNPCFNGYFSSTSIGGLGTAIFNFVSILVLMDISPQPSKKSSRRPPSNWVSILVLMDISPQQYSYAPNSHTVDVSILVLMDISPQQYPGFSFFSSSSKFQSLF